MKILQLARRFVTHEWGGTESVIAMLSKHFAIQGHSSELWTSSALSVPGHEKVAGVQVCRFKYLYPFFGLSPADKLALDKKGGNLISFEMQKALLASNPDIYHLHTGKRFGGQMALAARLRRKPYVITLHGGYLDVPDIERADLLDPIKGKLEWGKALGAILGSRTLLKRADAIFCVNPNEAKKLEAANINSRIEFLPNGVEAETFANGNGESFRKLHGYTAKDKIVLCISRLDHQKNQAGLLRAFAKACKMHNDYRLLLIGPQTNAAYVEKLSELAGNLEISAKLKILPALQAGSSELVDAYSAADVFVLPSLHEPFGIVILEAWASKKAVIASNVGGIPYFVKHDKSGLLFEANDIEMLASQIESVLEQNCLAKKLSENGFKKAVDEFAWDKIATRILGIYEELIAGVR